MEVMIAIALLSFALITLISKVHGCTDTARVTEYQNAAREFAKELMAEIEAGTIDGLFDGHSGDFSDRGYPHLKFVVGLGESSGVATPGLDPTVSGNQTALYEVPRDPWEVDPALDPTAEDTTEEPYTRVRIVVQYPTANDDITGVFTLERMVPTENSKGSRGLDEKKERDAERALRESTGNASPGASSAGGTGSGGGGGGGSKGPKAGSSVSSAARSPGRGL